MKILILTDYFPPKIGGIEQHVYEQSRTLMAKGHDVRIVTKDIGNSQPHLIGLPFLDIKYLRGLSFMLVLLLRLPALIREFRPDVIHAHSYQPAVAAIMAKRLFGIGTPLIMTAHGTVAVATVAKHSTLHRKLVGGAIKYFEKWSIKNADRVIVVDREIERFASDLRGGRNVAYVTNGVDTDRFEPQRNSTVRHRLGIPEKDVVIITTRRLDNKNNVITLAKAFDALCKQRHDIWLLVVGDGEQRQAIEAVGNPRIVLPGFVDNGRIPDYLHAADLLVMPSLYEATSISCLEAMACGLPVVATRVGGLPELIDGNGLLCEPTVDSLASAIRDVLKGDMPKMGQKSREIAVKRFSWDNIVLQHKRIYEEALKM